MILFQQEKYPKLLSPGAYVFCCPPHTETLTNRQITDRQNERETGRHTERQASRGCRHTGSQTQKGKIVRLRLSNEVDIQNKDRQQKTG